MHEKIIVIDEQVLYHGSLNALSQNDTTESMLRILNHRIVQEVSEYIKSERSYAGKQSKRLNIDQITLEKLEKIIISVKKLPPCKEACKCGGSLIPRLSWKNEAFYGCQYWQPPRENHSTVDLSLAYLEEIQELQKQFCPICGDIMSLNLRNKPQRVLLVCNNGSCGGMKWVVFTK
jgi:phosphatidylserine/phosphatidylglycerophosphate/cardiolipin synthase-like enzyme